MIRQLPLSALYVSCFCIFAAIAGTCAGDETKSADDKETPTAAAQDDAPAAPGNPFPDAVTVPPGILDGGTEWLNTSGPIDLKELRGKVVLLDFWTYCCINCIHVLPDLKYLEEKYKNELVVIGVHSAKFENEKLSENIRDAILRYEIRHPVVNDSEMTIWRKFGTRAWPTLALIDPEGKFAGAQGGEGNRELFDLVIGKVIEYHRWKGTLDEDPLVFELETNDTETAPLRYPGKILAHSQSNRLFISDSNHNRILVTDLNGTLIAAIGNGRAGHVDGDFNTAEFDHPQGMELVGDVLYVADTENHLLRAVNLKTKTVSTLAGTGVQGRPRDVDGDLKKTALNSPWALCHVNGVLYIAMAGPHQIWSHKLGSSEIKVHAGNAREDVINGKLPASSFAQPSGLSVNGDGSHFFVADSEGSAIRKVAVADDGVVTTIAGTYELPRGQSLFAFGDVDAAGADARFQHPLGVAWHDGFVYVADAYNHKIRRVNVKTGEVTTWLGTGKAGDTLSPVQLSEPAGLSITNGKLYIADTNNHRILQADLKSKEVSVVALNGVTVPEPRKTRKPPELDRALETVPQSVTAGDSMKITVDLPIREGFKLNTEYPVTWEVFLLEGDQILAPEALAGRDEAVVVNGAAEFEIPLSNTAGTGIVVVEVGYGYCGEKDGSLCRLATGSWKFSLSVSEDTEDAAVKLKFPDTNAASEKTGESE